MRRAILLDGDVGLVVDNALTELGFKDQSEPHRLGMQRLSPEELRQNIEDLKKTSDTYLPNGVNGGILFDGFVKERTDMDRFGQYVWLIEPDHIYLGRERLAQVVRVTSPILASSGVILKVGQRYRIFALNCDWTTEKEQSDTFFTWRGNVIRLGRAF